MPPEIVDASAFSADVQDFLAFLSVAVASSARALITGNLKHFPSDSREGVLVISPADFLARYRDLMDTT